jgi:hypothetical protein
MNYQPYQIVIRGPENSPPKLSEAKISGQSLLQNLEKKIEIYDPDLIGKEGGEL